MDGFSKLFSVPNPSQTLHRLQSDVVCECSSHLVPGDCLDNLRVHQLAGERHQQISFDFLLEDFRTDVAQHLFDSSALHFHDYNNKATAD